MLHMTVYIEKEDGVRQIETGILTNYNINIEKYKNDNPDGLLHIYIKEQIEAEANEESDA